MFWFSSSTLLSRKCLLGLQLNQSSQNTNVFRNELSHSLCKCVPLVVTSFFPHPLRTRRFTQTLETLLAQSLPPAFVFELGIPKAFHLLQQITITLSNKYNTIQYNKSYPSPIGARNGLTGIDVLIVRLALSPPFAHKHSELLSQVGYEDNRRISYIGDCLIKE